MCKNGQFDTMGIFLMFCFCFPAQRPKGAQTPSNCHTSPKCWQNISNTMYSTETCFPHPSSRRAHRHPPTAIYPPKVGRIYPIQIYIIQGPNLPEPNLLHPNFFRGPICRGTKKCEARFAAKWARDPICQSPICRGPICLEPK